MEIHWCQKHSLRVATNTLRATNRQLILDGLGKLNRHFYVTGRTQEDAPGVHGFTLAGCDLDAGEYAMMSLSYVNKRLWD